MTGVSEAVSARRAGTLRFLSLGIPAPAAQPFARLAQNSIRPRWLILRISLGQGVDDHLQTREASVGLCAEVCKHLAISALDTGKSCIYPRKHRSDDVPMHHVPQGVKLGPQLLYRSLGLFNATGEIAHKSLTCFLHELLKQAA
jgi:hypothetical protein